jgi:hypothetical protein
MLRPALEFHSFESFLSEHQSQDLSQTHIIIKCETFDRRNFPSPLGFGKIKIGLMDITCDDFSASKIRDLVLYIDDCYQPKIRINTENQIFPNSNSFVMLAHIGKNLTLDLNSRDKPGDIARNRDYHLYFSNPESRQHRPDIQLFANGNRIPHLRPSTISSQFLYQ